ncbi:MAG: DUF4367 domain-containing protein [Ruminococcus sp.]|nr:DUF4367 domain-containing protein [Ruminococcus sp.]
MTETRLSEAVLAALTEEYSAELYAQHEEQAFSPRFEKKMNSLVKRRRKPFYPLISTALRRVACLLVILGTGLLLGFKGAVYAIDKFSDDFYFAESEGRLTVFSNKAEGAPTTIETRLAPAYLPEGFALDHGNEGEEQIYLNYNNGEEEIFFSQYTKNKFYIVCLNEASDFERIDINGHSALFREAEGWCEVFWDNGDYILAMTSPVSKDELLRCARSVQKAEN